MNSKQRSGRIPLPTCGYYLDSIYFYLTEGCNLKCRHCWVAPGYQTADSPRPSLGYELFKHIVRQGMELGLTGVKLTGGEPLIHPDIEKIISFVAEENLNLTIETNGVMCTPALVKVIGRARKPFVSVSIEGSDRETHEWVRGVEGCFDAAVDGVRNLAAAGMKPQIIMSIMNRNKDQMEDVVRLAETIGAGSVKFNIVTPAVRGRQMHESGQTIPIEELVKIGEWVENRLAPSSKVAIIHSHPDAFRPLGKICGAQNARCGITGIIGVLSSGKYALCGIGENVRELVFGDASADKLSDVWCGSSVLRAIREGLPEKLSGVCGQCLMRKKCMGSCVAMNYCRSHDLFAPYWYCDEAFNAGVFPESRLKPGVLKNVPVRVNLPDANEKTIQGVRRKK